MKTDENNPEDWYRSAKVRLGSVDRLYPLEGMSESVIELLQESAERFLKGYLISKGWPLSRIHDLGALIADAQKYDERFGCPDLISFKVNHALLSSVIFSRKLAIIT